MKEEWHYRFADVRIVEPGPQVFPRRRRSQPLCESLPCYASRRRLADLLLQAWASISWRCVLPVGCFSELLELRRQNRVLWHDCEKERWLRTCILKKVVHMHVPQSAACVWAQYTLQCQVAIALAWCCQKAGQCPATPTFTSLKDMLALWKHLWCWNSTS